MRDPKQILAAAETKAAHLGKPRARPPGEPQHDAELLTRIVVPGATPKPHTAKHLRGAIGRIKRRTVARAYRALADDARGAETPHHLDLADALDEAAQKIEAGLQ